MVVSYAGSGVIYAFKPGLPMDQLQLLKPVDAAPAAGPDRRPPGRRLAPGERPRDRGPGAEAVPLPVTGRDQRSSRRQGFRRRHDELGHQELGSAAQLRPGGGEARPAFLRDERGGSDDVERRARPDGDFTDSSHSFSREARASP